jgi:hypothetical protein
MYGPLLTPARPAHAPETVLFRAVAVLGLVLALHILPLLLITLSAPQKPETTESFAVDLADLEALAALIPVPTPEKESARPPEPKTESAAPKPEPPAPLVASARQTAPAPAPAPEKPAAAPQPDKAPPSPALKPLDLEPFNAPGVAFDESTATKEIPKDGFLSDRNSTAADLGPKTLPRGAPFMDKGESSIVRYRERRGEGNTPALPSDANAGSIRKEGSPDAGKGLPDPQPANREKPLALPATPAPRVQAGTPEPPPEPPRQVQRPQPVVSTPPVPETLPPETQHDPKKPILGDGPALIDEEKTPNVVEVKRPLLAAANQQPDPQPALTQPREPERLVPAPPQAAAPERKPIDELAALRALLDATGDTPGRGGNSGEKAGINARAGQRGHEGDGTPRPGHDNAVSDVTTINLESSAENTGEARFAKRFDPKAAYAKPLARRIDAKWKAEIVARARPRLTMGVVAVKVTVSREGKLLGVEELGRNPKALPDEAVAIVKTAVTRATEPTGDPFPPELSQFESLDFVFNFFYAN